MIKFVSTRNEEKEVSSSEAIIDGLASDGGLYAPIIQDEKIDISQLVNKSYQDIAFSVLSKLLVDFSDEEIKDCIKSAYDSKWDDKNIVPVTKYSKGYIAEIWHGPTCAFKDIALTILPHFMTKAYTKQNMEDKILILTATSGDTGKAALSGFADVDNTNIIVFYPSEGVSDTQKRQMCTSLGKNVDVVAVLGNFDDCQRMVKEASTNEEIINNNHHISISSANSINLGRLVPQIVYYFSSYLHLVNEDEIKLGDKVNFSVPTGNFGNILAGYLARELGLPINKLICASNSNHILTDFFNTGTYSLDRPFYTTISPSMDILISSNLERLLFLLSDSNTVNELMNSLRDNKEYKIPNEMLEKINEVFLAAWTNEDECKETIKQFFMDENILIDPHTAVALKASEQFYDPSIPTITLSTASPYKFASDVLATLSDEVPSDSLEAIKKLHDISNVEIPNTLLDIYDLPIRFTETINKEDGLKTILKKMEVING